MIRETFYEDLSIVWQTDETHFRTSGYHVRDKATITVEGDFDVPEDDETELTIALRDGWRYIFGTLGSTSVGGPKESEI